METIMTGISARSLVAMCATLSFTKSSEDFQPVAYRLSGINRRDPNHKATKDRSEIKRRRKQKHKCRRK